MKALQIVSVLRFRLFAWIITRTYLRIGFLHQKHPKWDRVMKHIKSTDMKYCGINCGSGCFHNPSLRCHDHWINMGQEWVAKSIIEELVPSYRLLELGFIDLLEFWCKVRGHTDFTCLTGIMTYEINKFKGFFLSK